jgi:hypothetical protein
MVTSSSVIKELQMEITNYCQARCPECAREKDYLSKYKKPKSPYFYELNTKYISVDEFKSWFNKDDWQKLKLIDFCGNYDEPTTNPDLLKIIDWILSADLFPKDLVVNIATNGGTRSTEFWKDMGNLCEKYRTGREHSRLRVVWGIDGLEDTNHIYRINVKWDKLQENFRAFLSSGGYGYWQFIYFNHNKHQEKEVNQRSIDEGFVGMKWRGGQAHEYSKTEIKPTEIGKFKGKGKVDLNQIKNVLELKNTDKDTLIETLEASGNDKWDVRDAFKNKVENEISCKAMLGYEDKEQFSRLYVTYHGWVIPCCWWGTQLELNNIYDTYSKDTESHKLNGKNSFEEILKSSWFTDVHNYIQTHQPNTCISHCKENVYSKISTRLNT